MIDTVGFMSKKIFILSQSIYQTNFWILVALKAKEQNLNLTIICFDYESQKALKINKINFLNLNSRNFKISLSKCRYYVKKFNLLNLRSLLFHETNYYLEKSSNNAFFKFFNYLDALQENFKKNKKKNLIFISELGAFTSNISSYIYAKENNIKHFFIEPSFFPGRIHFLKNTINCNPVVNNKLSINKARSILDQIIKNKQINIPSKDEHQFKLPIFKIFNFHNIKRLFIKVFYKYFLRKKSEFDNPFAFSTMIFNNFLNYLFIKKYYIKLKNINNIIFFYYPLHVPNDIALTLRSQNYYNQIKVVRIFAEKLKKKKIFLVIKEHPARIGAYNRKLLVKLLKEFKNIKILEPFENSFQIIKKSSGVITINSKSGFETILLNKPLVCLGDSYFKNFKGLTNLEDLIENKSTKYQQKDIDKFFKNLFCRSFSGELYNNKKTNVDNFFKSLLKIVK
jgi:hypothetical protein